MTEEGQKNDKRDGSSVTLTSGGERSFFNFFQGKWLNINILPGNQQTAGTVLPTAYQRMRTSFAKIGPEEPSF